MDARGLKITHLLAFIDICGCSWIAVTALSRLKHGFDSRRGHQISPRKTVVQLHGDTLAGDGVACGPHAGVRSLAELAVEHEAIGDRRAGRCSGRWRWRMHRKCGHLGGARHPSRGSEAVGTCAASASSSGAPSGQRCSISRPSANRSAG